MNNEIQLYIPSTENVNVEAKPETLMQVHATLENLFCDLFGGATIRNVTGLWKSDEHGIVKESVTIIEANTPKTQVELLAIGIQWAQVVCTVLSQECVSLRVNGTLYLIDSDGNDIS